MGMNALLFLKQIYITNWSGAPAESGCYRKPDQEREKVMNLVSGSHNIGQNLYHLEWCPKYRFNMFKQEENKKLCEKILQEIAKRHQIKITEMSVMPDHIHIIAQLPTTMSVSQAFHLLKGTSSRELFKQKPNYRHRYPKGHFWSPGKFYRTIGDANIENVIQYIREQRLQQTTLNGYSTDSKST